MTVFKTLTKIPLCPFCGHKSNADVDQKADGEIVDWKCEQLRNRSNNRASVCD